MLISLLTAHAALVIPSLSSKKGEVRRREGVVGAPPLRLCLVSRYVRMYVVILVNTFDHMVTNILIDKHTRTHTRIRTRPHRHAHTRVYIVTGRSGKSQVDGGNR